MKTKRTIATAWVFLLAVACGSPPSEEGFTGARNLEPKREETMAFEIRSKAFAPGERIPVKHTGEGTDVSPPLAWNGAPEGTREYALIVDDPDAPRPEPWVHWVLYSIDDETTSLVESDNGGGVEGRNDFGDIGYGGPMPPPGHGVHHYHFKLYALDTELDLKEGASKDDLLQAMEGHILGETELVGTYERD